MFSESEIKRICRQFDIECNQIGAVIDTSRSDEDKRYNYNINNQYFLKINTSKAVTEEFLQDIVKLIFKYREIGVYCPALIKSNTEALIYIYTKEAIEYICYMEECAPYKTYNSNKYEIDYNFKKTVVGHLGKLAKEFSNHELSYTKSMWSLIELGAFNIDRDEKQENLDTLVTMLKQYKYYDLASRLLKANIYNREQIEKHLHQLPRCVYQGDLNESNLLIDEQGAFKGIIDFNMFGTEVNINCFLNETMYYLEIENFEHLSAKEIFNKMNNEQENMLSEILKSYKLNKLEIAMWKHYKKIIYMSFYPNVMLLNSLLEKSTYVDKALELIDIIVSM